MQIHTLKANLTFTNNDLSAYACIQSLNHPVIMVKTHAAISMQSHYVGFTAYFCKHVG